MQPCYFVIFPNWQLMAPDSGWFLLENGRIGMECGVELVHYGRIVELEEVGGVCLGSINRSSGWKSKVPGY